MMRALLAVALFLPVVAMAADDDSTTTPSRSTASHDQVEHTMKDSQMQPMPGDADHETASEWNDHDGNTAKDNTFFGHQNVRY